MSRQLTVRWTCDAAACGIVVYEPILEDGPPFNPPMLGDWKGTAKVQFCPKHENLVHSHRPAPTHHAACNVEHGPNETCKMSAHPAPCCVGLVPGFQPDCRCPASADGGPGEPPEGGLRYGGRVARSAPAAAEPRDVAATCTKCPPGEHSDLRHGRLVPPATAPAADGGDE